MLLDHCYAFGFITEALGSEEKACRVAPLGLTFARFDPHLGRSGRKTTLVGNHE